jgi:DNA-binding LacI/PurR family transcriptional regulator
VSIADGKRRPTIRDVAARSAVSIQTVSNLVNGRHHLMTPETRIRVEAAMAELGYHPNMAARSLRSTRSGTLCFLLLEPGPRFLADPMTDLVIAGIGDIASGRRHADRLAELGVPIVLIEESDDPRTFSVIADDHQGARLLAEHLIAAGHETIAFAATEISWPMIEQRLLGYREALAQVDLAPGELYGGDWLPISGAVHVERVLSATPRPTALMCCNNLLALGAIRAARERGIDVPHGLAVTGFDDFVFSEFADPALTTVSIPGYEIGQTAAQLLTDALDGHAPHVARSFSLSRSRCASPADPGARQLSQTARAGPGCPRPRGCGHRRRGRRGGPSRATRRGRSSPSGPATHTSAA